MIDNAADEALAGFGKKIKVTLHGDGSFSVEDDGRGIPFGLHPEEKAPVVELGVHPPARRRQVDKGLGGAYSFSGGLHGVGVSVTNALSRRMEVTSYRDGQVARIGFAGGDVAEPLSVRASNGSAEGDRRQGTTVRAWPDGKYFGSRRTAAGRTGAPAAQQGRADARCDGAAGRREEEGHPDLAVQGRPARLPGADPARRRGDPGFRRRGLRRQGRRHLRRGRGRPVGRGLHRRRRAGARELRQPDPHQCRRHPRQRLREGLFQAVKSFIDLCTRCCPRASS